MTGDGRLNAGRKLRCKADRHRRQAAASAFTPLMSTRWVGRDNLNAMIGTETLATCQDTSVERRDFSQKRHRFVYRPWCMVSEGSSLHLSPPSGVAALIDRQFANFRCHSAPAPRNSLSDTCIPWHVKQKEALSLNPALSDPTPLERLRSPASSLSRLQRMLNEAQLSLLRLRYRSWRCLPMIIQTAPAGEPRLAVMMYEHTQIFGKFARAFGSDCLEPVWPNDLMYCCLEAEKAKD